jgi:uncharacterized protein (TIGR03435 family)
MAELLSELAERPVIDNTGFAGSYCAPFGQDPVAALDLAHFHSGGATLSQTIEERWGLKLEPQQRRLEILVVDHVARPATN